MWNSGENDEHVTEIAQSAAHGAAQVEAQESAQGDAQGGGSGSERETVTPVEEELSAEEIERVALFRKYRDRLSDVPDERIERLVIALREGKSNRAAARELVEEGYAPHLNPATVRNYVAEMRAALGIPGWEPAEKPDAEDEKDEPIEGQPSRKQLTWLTRIQQARVRKALKLEGMMGTMILPTTSHEIQIMQDLIDKGLEIELKTGELKQEPQKVEVTQTDPRLEGVTMSEAYRVWLVCQKLAKLAPEILEARNPDQEAE